MIGPLSRPLAAAPVARRPYPDPLTIEELCAVEEAIGVALDAILAEKVLERPLVEIKVTRRLRTRLNEMLSLGQPVPGFNCRIFETVVVGNEEENAAGTELEKRPDLTIRRSGEHPLGVQRGENALFIECKVVDRTRTMKRYVPDGLARFVDGRYASAVSIGLMVAYVDGAYSLPGTLEQYLRRKDCPCPAPVTRRGGASQRGVHVTSHARTWPYPDGGAPGAVRVGHLWVTAR